MSVKSLWSTFSTHLIYEPPLTFLAVLVNILFMVTHPDFLFFHWRSKGPMLDPLLFLFFTNDLKVTILCLLYAMPVVKFVEFGSQCRSRNYTGVYTRVVTFVLSIVSRIHPCTNRG